MVDYPDGTLPIVHVGSIVVEGFVGILGTVEVYGDVTVTGTVAISGTVTVTGAVTVTGTVSISGTVTVTGAVTVTGTVSISGTVTVTGSVTVSGTVAISGTVTVTGTVAISGTVTVTGAVTVTGTVSISGTVTVTGAVTVTGTVAISGTVTVTGAVTISGPVTISTIAADNIIIDRLTAGAYTANTTTVTNNGAVVTWKNIGSGYYDGKFFPRGMRGFLQAIEIYCKNENAAQKTITIYISPYIGSGYVYTATLSIAGLATADWRIVYFNKMWEYDSLFIYVETDSTDVYYGSDSGEPVDYFTSSDSGATWTYSAWRMWFRVTLRGQTCGDVPVSGTVNIIEIPNAVGVRSEVALEQIPARTSVYDTTQYGSGRTIAIYFFAGSAWARDYLYPRVLVDGVSILPYDNDFDSWQTFMLTERVGFEGIALTKYEVGMAVLAVTLRFPFKRTLQVGFYNAHPTEAINGVVSYSYEKIS
jgi:cytoskeletal protein CcmA (bactofilin family)